MYADDAVEVTAARRADAPVFITCEHASARLPEPWKWPPADEWVASTHWAFDLGARELAQEIGTHLGGTLVLSRFSRLLVDPNRPLEAPDLIVEVAEGKRLEINCDLLPAEREQRVERLWRAYHATVDHQLGVSRAGIVLAVHTFTPVYNGQARSLEAGVLFDTEEALALTLHAALASAGLDVALNEPYSGKRGLIYSADRHARAHGRRAVELELRQDLAEDEAFRTRVAEAISRAFA